MPRNKWSWVFQIFRKWAKIVPVFWPRFLRVGPNATILMENAFAFTTQYVHEERKKNCWPSICSWVGWTCTVSSLPCSWLARHFPPREQWALTLNRNVTRLSLFTRKLEVEHDLWLGLRASDCERERATTFSRPIYHAVYDALFI